MSYSIRTLPPSWSASTVRAFAGLAFSLTLASSVGACADQQPTAPSAAVPAPAAAHADVTPASLFDDYSPNTSAHFTHMRTQIADYRITYQPAANQAAEYLWTGQHYDRVILDWGDNGSIPQYRAVNPSMQIVRYAINWTVMQPTSPSAPNIAATYYPDMTAWYAAHPSYQLETAFLHTAGCGATAACRISFKIWNDDRWAVNPGDAGLRAYQRDRLGRLASDADGVFLDEHGSGDTDPLSANAIAEYPSFSAYQTDLVAMLADERTALAGKHIAINNATYITSWDADMVRAAGGSHGEGFIDAAFGDMESRWTFAETALGAGVAVDVGTSGAVPSTYTLGNYGSALERRQLFDLASYYLVAPTQPGLLYYNLNGSTWSQPFSTTWFKAVEADIGLPSGARRLQAQGTDPSGRAYHIWARDYSAALVLTRPIISWTAQSYGDETGVAVTLPTDYDYRLLHADGSLGAVVTSVTLRASESAILIKQAKVVTPPPTTSPAASPGAANPVLVVIDQDAVAVNIAPNYFTKTDINDDIATVGQRKELRYFTANVGKSVTLYTGKMGGYEGVYAPRSIPASWTSAGPTANGLVNFFRAGPGLGTDQTLLASVPNAVPLRATGLKMLVGRTVCAVFIKTNAWVASFNPIALGLQGPDRGVAAFRVDAITAYSSSTTAVQLPKLSVTILSAAQACSGDLDPLSGAPAPASPQLPFDVVP